MSGVIRDFSKSSISKLRSAADNTNDSLHLFDWFHDTSLTDALNIRDNMNDLSYYHQVVMDKYSIGNQKLNQIITDVNDIDHSKSSAFEMLYGIIEGYGDTVKRLSESMKCGYMGAENSIFTDYLKEIENCYQSNKYKTIFGTDDINEIMELIQSKASLSIIEIKAFFELATVYPDIPVSQKVINVVLGSLKNFLDEYGDLLKEAFSIASKTAISLGNFVYKVATIAGPTGKNSFIMMNATTSEFLVASKKAASTFKIYSGVLAGAALTLGVWDDLENNGKTMGQAIVHNGVGVAYGTLTIVLVSTTLPIGLGLVVGVVGMAMSQKLYDYMYDNNILGIQDALDSFGNWLDDVGSKVGNTLIDFGNMLGECTSQLFDCVNPFS